MVCVIVLIMVTVFITVFAMVSLKSQAEESLKAFEEHMNTLPEVRECHMLNGEIDFIIKIVSRDLQSFQELARLCWNYWCKCPAIFRFLSLNQTLDC